MKFKTVAVLLGAVVASSFPLSAKFGPSSAADAADAVQVPAPPEARVPEFVPVVNFSEFVLAMQSFAAQNPPASRIAAEALSAKFAFNSGSEEAKLQTPMQPVVAPAINPPAPVIVTRPVATATVPVVAEPAVAPPQVPDPVKLVTGYAEEQPVHRKRRKVEKTAAEVPSAPHTGQKFQPAMGLGMTIFSAEEAPPMSAIGKKKDH